MPLTVVAVTVPCNAAVPATRVAVMTRPLSVAITLPRQSCTWIAGCGAKITPAVALAGGAVWNPKVLAPPEPKLIAGLVLAVLALLVMSVAVTVALLPVVRVIAKVFVPATNAVLAGRIAFTSLELRPTVSVTLVAMFQFASTALTVTLNAVQADCAVGVPLFPLLVPGTVVSPGANNCSLTKVPALTV